MTPLAATMERYREVILAQALPFWSTVGVDGDRGFVEVLDLAGDPRRVGFKRVRVHARQTYVFSHAATLGFEPGLAVARRGLAFLLANGLSPRGAWAVAMGDDGGLADDACDLYDQAFVILALAWYFRASGDGEALAWIDRTLLAIDTCFARSDGQGYRSRLPDSGEALQNPHMHLLEALLALWDVRPDAALRSRIERLLDLFRTRLFVEPSGTLREFFTTDWTPAAGERGELVEPGHHYEWTWLLYEARRRLGIDLAGEAERLFAFAERHGLEPATGFIHDSLRADGSVHSGRHRSWPQTERVKAILSRAEFAGVVDGDGLKMALDALLSRYFAPGPRPGTWIDHLDAAGEPDVAAVPASTLYHMFLACTELERCKYMI